MNFFLALFAVIGSAVYFHFASPNVAPAPMPMAVEQIPIATAATSTQKARVTAAKVVAPAKTTPPIKKAGPSAPKVAPTPVVTNTATSESATPQPSPSSGSTATAEPAQATPAPTQNPDSSPAISPSSLALAIHAGINSERTKAGLSALAWDSQLAAIALSHSKDMGTSNYFSHTNLLGEGFSDRYERNEYLCEVVVGSIIYGGGENLYQNNRYDSYTIRNGVTSYDWNSEAEIAASTVEGWMNSPGHRKNILTSYFQKEGIGVYFAADDRIYITQNFC